MYKEVLPDPGSTSKGCYEMLIRILGASAAIVLAVFALVCFAGTNPLGSIYTFTGTLILSVIAIIVCGVLYIAARWLGTRR